MSSIFEMHSIGIVHSPFQKAMGTPVQPFAAAQFKGGAMPFDFNADLESPQIDARGGCGSLELIPRWVDALQDLDGFSHIWVLFWCHLSGEPHSKVLPYRDTVERGLFATRVPARPNPIGISCVRIRAVEGRFIHVAEMDILNETPILDIKPYIPLYDLRLDAQNGWLDSPTAMPGAMQADERFSR